MADTDSAAVCTGGQPIHNWLNEFESNLTSQSGEDGVIEKALEVIGVGDKWCVEFGGWDGKVCSNTYRLITEKDFHGVLIEADPKRYQDLLKTHGDNEKVHTINAFVDTEGQGRLGCILKQTDAPEDFDLLSIDIDGNDYHVWQAFEGYRPKLVVIEYNPTIPNEVEFVQPCEKQVTQGASILSLTKLAKSKGYELIAATAMNAFFVDDRYFGLFEIEDNSVHAIRRDTTYLTHLFFGYDGTVFLRGYGGSPWQSIRLKESKVQILPGWARKRHGDTNRIRRSLGKKWRRLMKRLWPNPREGGIDV